MLCLLLMIKTHKNYHQPEKPAAHLGFEGCERRSISVTLQTISLGKP